MKKVNIDFSGSKNGEGLCFKLVIMPAFIIANLFVLLIFFRWLIEVNPVFYNWVFIIIAGVIHFMFASVMLVAYFMPHGTLHTGMQRFVNYWYGCFIYLLILIATAYIIKLVLCITGTYHSSFASSNSFLFGKGIFVLFFAGFLSIYGLIHAKHIYTKYYFIDLNGEDINDEDINDDCEQNIESLKIVLAADMHLGHTIGIKYMKKMTDMINEQKPDLVCFAGDIFDNDFESVNDAEEIKAEFKRIDSTYGVYGCWGNHDVKERLISGFSVTPSNEAIRDKRFESFMADSDVRMLEDEVVLIADKFNLIGRLDYEKAGDGTNNRKSIEELTQKCDSSKPILLLDHEPRQLKRNSKNGVNLMLSGHTHGGQFFPLNIGSFFTWENDTGLKKEENMYCVVTSGVGLHGPAIRIGTRADITVIDLKFKVK